MNGISLNRMLQLPGRGRGLFPLRWKSLPGVLKMIKKIFKFFFLFALQAFLYNATGPVNIAWDPVSQITVDHYEIQVIRDSGEVSTYATSNVQITIPRSGAGRFTVQVRAVGMDTEGQAASTPYCASTDSSCANLPNGNAGGWKILWRPSPGGTIR
jgi:hypothetical protein